LQKEWNEICMKQLTTRKYMENDCLPRTLKFEMITKQYLQNNFSIFTHLYSYAKTFSRTLN
jgi:hypothetical protein